MARMRTQEDHQGITGWPPFRSWSDCAQLNHVNQAIWIFEVEPHRIWWANRAALALWRAASLDELVARDFESDSITVRRRLNLVLEHASTAQPVRETWTIYPKGQPIAVDMVLTPVTIGADEEPALLIEGRPVLDARIGKDEWRMLEATRYTSIMISYFSIEGALIASNPAAAKVYGLPGDAIATLKSDTSAGADFAARFTERAEGLELLRKGRMGQEDDGELLMRTKGGPRWHRLEIRQSRDPVTGAPTLLMIEEDASEQRSAIEELASFNRDLERRVEERTLALRAESARAEEANRTKSDFLARMSHDLRTPLNAILGFSRMLFDQNFDYIQGPKRKEYAEIIHGAAANLLSMVNDLLEISRIEAGEYPTNFSEVSLVEFLEATLQLLNVEYAERRIDLDVSRFPEELIFISDPRALALIVTNLVTNAIKYSSAPSVVTVSVGLEDGRFISIAVTDSGIGISESELANLFKPYVRSQQAASKTVEGTGLGLSICHDLSMLLGGSLAVASELGVGTTITLRLPLSQNHPPLRS